jgi:hypothetical protein
MRISGYRIHSLSGYSTLENPRFQFDIYSTVLDDLTDVSDAMIAALISYGEFDALPLYSPQDDWSDEVQLYRRILDVSFWHQE